MVEKSKNTCPIVVTIRSNELPNETRLLRNTFEQTEKEKERKKKKDIDVINEEGFKPSPSTLGSKGRSNDFA